MEQMVALRMDGVRKYAAAKIEAMVVENQCLVEMREQHDPTDGRTGGDDQQAVVTPGVGSADRRRAPAAQTISL